MLPSNYNAKQSTSFKSIKRLYFTLRNAAYNRLPSLIICLTTLAILLYMLYYALSFFITTSLKPAHITSIDTAVTYNNEKITKLQQQHTLQYYTTASQAQNIVQWYEIPFDTPYIIDALYDTTQTIDNVVTLPAVSTICLQQLYQHQKALSLHSDSFISAPQEYESHQRYQSYINPSILVLNDKHKFNNADILLSVRYHHFIGHNYWNTNIVAFALKPHADDITKYSITHIYDMSAQHILQHVNLIDNCFYNYQLTTDLINGGTDSRFLTFQNHIYISYSYYSSKQIQQWNNNNDISKSCTLLSKQYSGSVYVTSIDNEQPTHNIELLIDAPNTVEKNWLLFDPTDVLTDVDTTNKQLYGIYMFNPMSVVSIEMDTGITHEIHRTHATELIQSVFNTEIVRTHLSAGPVVLPTTDDVRFKNTMLSIFHTIPIKQRVDRIYTHYYYIQSRTAPYAITCINTAPITLHDIDGVNFISSLHMDGNMLVIGYGVGDTYSRIVTVSLDGVLSSTNWQCMDKTSNEHVAELQFIPYYTQSYGHNKIKLLTLPSGSKYPYIAIFQRIDNTNQHIAPKVSFVGCVMDIQYYCVREPVLLGINTIDIIDTDNVYIYIHKNRIMLHHITLLPVHDNKNHVVAEHYIQCLNTAEWLHWILPNTVQSETCNEIRWHSIHTVIDTELYYSITPYITTDNVQLLYNNIDTHHGDVHAYVQDYTIDNDTITLNYITHSISEHDEHHGTKEHVVSLLSESLPFNVQTSQYRQGVLLSIALYNDKPNTVQLIYRHTSHATDILDIQLINLCALSNKQIQTMCYRNQICVTGVTLQQYKAANVISKQADYVLLSVIASHDITQCSVVSNVIVLGSKAFVFEVTVQELLSIAQ